MSDQSLDIRSQSLPAPEFSKLLGFIEAAARVNSFSSYENRLHSLIETTAARARVIHPDGENLIVRCGEPERPRIALTAHMDKINHFGENPPDRLEFSIENENLLGLLDDAVGVGMLLWLVDGAGRLNLPPLDFYFSEMEESNDWRDRRAQLKNGGDGIYPGIGAERIATHLLETDLTPEMVITVDVSPLFKGEPGVAVYSEHWRVNKLVPNAAEIEATNKVVELFREINADILLSRNTNDFLTYGKMLNYGRAAPVVSVAIEPSVFPYHRPNEKVRIKDIEIIALMLLRFISEYSSRSIPV